MSYYASELLSPEEVTHLWDDIRPMIAESCASNELTEDTLTPEHILGLAVTGQCGVIGFFENSTISLVLVVQFCEDNGRKAASILAFGGQDMMTFKRLYWDYILGWLRNNGIEYIDTYANERMAKVFQKKFGFTKASVCVRLPLKESYHG